MTDNEQEDQKSTFQLLDEGTMFTGRHFWYNGEARDLRCAVGVWSWDDVSSVGTLPTETLPEMPEPRCVLYWRDTYLYLQAHFVEVQRAWRQYRKRQTVRHALPFSGIFPFSGN
jgi:hypothetical protein